MASGYADPIGEGALWIKTSKKGAEFLSGVMTFAPSPGAPPLEIQIVAFSQDEKKSDKAPDYRVFVNSCGPGKERRTTRRGSGAPSPEPAGKGQDSRPPEDEDIPF